MPVSIESYLSDASFSGTEIIILRKLIECNALTLREIAAKSGKSTGVLDQAMKKLMKKKIVSCETINGTPKYILRSLKVVQNWMREDMQQKQQMIIRRYENFEVFLSTLKKIKHRPEMEFFEGTDGMKRAHMKLFECGKVLLRYGPTLWAEDDDPLKDFREEYFRECKKRQIFVRGITHDTPLGRRYRSRDPFEYRETVLVDAAQEPFKFEKIIVGDTVACFHYEAEEACFVHYSALAEEERAYFEAMWHRNKDQKPIPLKDSDVVEMNVPIKTELLSDIRHFFLGYRGLIGLATCAVLSGLLTGAFFWQMANANLQKIREQVKSVAATGALQFDTADLDQLHTKADITKPEYAKVIGQLNAIRTQNKDVAYMYIVRLKQNFDYEFVADADSLNLDAVIDLNKDGKIDSMDEMISPGRKTITRDHVFQDSVIYGSAASNHSYTDEWGTFISGASPIYDKAGNVNAILGVDKWAKDIYAGVTTQRISIFFVLAFIIFVCVWLLAFDRYLLKEVQKYMAEQKNVSAELLKFFFTRKSGLTLIGLALISGVATFALYQNNASLNLKRVQEKVLSIAATGALQFQAKDLDQLHTADDVTKPEYAKTIYLLNAIRQQNEGVKYAYVMRPTKEGGVWEFVADADSLDLYVKKDLNGDGIVNEEDHLSPPGEIYQGVKNVKNINEALLKPIVIQYTDQWGDIISGWAPIKNASGSTVAVFGVDKFTSDVNGLTTETMKPVYYFLVIFFILIFIRLAAFNRSLIKEIYELVHIRKFIVTIGISVLASLIITFGLYEYTQHLVLTRMRDKVIAIAVTGSSQFNTSDLNVLEKKEDWEKPEYKKITNQLGRIKKENTGVIYAYIIRKSKIGSHKMEFISDADSLNPFANTDNDPANDVDMNHDGKIDGSPTGGDYQSWPGQIYPTAPEEAFDAYNGPTTTSSFYEDQWGKTISGYAPIKDQNNNVVGILAIDMDTDSQTSLTRESFAPFYVFIIFFILFILFRIKGFNKSLLHQLLKPFINRLTVLIIIFSVTVISGIGVAIYEYTLHLMTEEIGTRLMSIAATAAPEFSADDLNQIHIAADMKKEEYQRVFKKLNEIRKHNQNIKWVYIYRKTNQPGIWSFIADADSNYYVPFENGLDPNDDGKLVIADENVYPGKTYDMGYFSPQATMQAFKIPMYALQIAPDQWGVWISGYAPIRDAQGNIIAVLGLDMNISDIYKIVWSKFNFFE